MRFRTFLSIGIIFLLSSVLALAALDLKFTTAISQSPDPANEGNVVTFTVSFKTFGDSVTNLKITGGVDGAQIFERMYASIAADKLRTDSFTWTATAGNHTVWFELDPNHTAGDSNYSNNRIENAFVIQQTTPVGKPNLTVSASYTPTSVVNGANIVFSATVSNSGNADSAPCKLGFYVFGGLEKEFDIPALTPGQNKVVAHNWIADCNPPCNAYVHFIADSTKIIAESDENDNIWIKQSICNCANQQLTNLKTWATYSPASFKGGDTVKFIIWVENTSAVPSPEVQMSFSEGKTVRQTFDVLGMGGNTKGSYVFDWIATCNSTCRNRIDIFIDSLNQAVETDENDNHWTQNVGCSCIQTLPSIGNPIGIETKNQGNMFRGKKANLKMEPGSFIYSPAGSITFIKFKVINTGPVTAAATNVQVQTRDGNTVLYSTVKPVPSLGPNQTYEVILHGVSYSANCQAVITIDCYGELTESNETDNIFTQTLSK
jgi:subtilase family serine protease